MTYPCHHAMNIISVAIVADRQYTETGDQLLIIKFKLHPGYHIYEHVPEAGAFHTTEVEVSLPQGYTALGELQRPIGKNFENGIRIYEDEVVMTQRIAGSSKDPITVTVNYQCCDSQICFTPEEKQISVK